MGRVLGFIFFMFVLVGGVIFLYTHRGLPAGGSIAAKDDVDIITAQDRAVSRVDGAVERTGDLADEVIQLALRLEEAATEAEETAENSLQLADTNEAAEASVGASFEAAERARVTAAVARRVGEELKRAALDANTATDDAEEITRVAVDVERSKKEAEEAAAKAREAEEEMRQAQSEVDEATVDAEEYLTRNGEDGYEPAAYQTEPDYDDGDTTIILTDGEEMEGPLPGESWDDYLERIGEKG